MVTEERTDAETPGPPPAPGVGPAPGTAIGRFIVLGTLGSGGMGVVVQAFDPWLDRKVAIKLLRPLGDDRESAEKRTARLLREAQAMARITHVNVIGVHDVGLFGDQVFIAMEHIEGQTLTRWLAAPRPWRELALKFAGAARGLGAAHARGLVHRDFKPDNVLCARDGRVLVTDFGVVGVAAQPGAGAPAVAAAELPHHGLTADGAIVGTPAYMAPEQRAGGPVDGRADQYSLCVALDRALGKGAPRWLARVAQRGLAADPAARFSSMAALADRLERDPARTARVALLGVLVATLLGAAALRGRGQAQPCAGLRANLAGVWDGARRADVERAFRASGQPYARGALDAVVAGLDAWAARWVDMRGDACTAARVRRDQSEEVLDLRVECLDLRRDEARALVDVLAQADDAVIENGPQAVAALGDVAVCANVALLRAPPRVPDRPALAAAVAAVRARLDLVGAMAASGRHAGILQHALAARVAAIGLGFGPLVAEAEAQLAVALQVVSDLPGRRRALLDAVAAADASRRDDLRARALVQLYHQLGALERKPEEAEPYRRLAAAAIARLGERQDPGREVAAQLLRVDGLVLAGAGRSREALEKYRASQAAYERFSPASRELPAILLAIAEAESSLGSLDAALADARAALAARERLAGDPRHPSLSNYHASVGKMLALQGDHRAARVQFASQLELARVPTARQRALVNLAALDNLLGEHATAAGEASEALALGEQVYGRDSNRLGSALMALGEAQLGGGDRDAAGATFARLLAIYERELGPEHVELISPLNALAEIDLQLGRLDEAGARLERARALLEKADQPIYLPPLLVNLGRLALRRGQPGEARADAERALELARAHGDRDAAADASFVLAQALAGDDPARARALALEARGRYAALGGGGAARLGAVDAWLAARR